MTETQFEPIPIRLHPDDLDALITGRGKIRKRRAARTNTLYLAAGNLTQQLLPQANNRKEAWLTFTQAPSQTGFGSVGNGTTTGPAAGTVIATTAVLPAGTYVVEWTVGLGGTTGAGDANNFELNAGGAAELESMNSTTSGNNFAQPNVTVTLSSPGVITVTALANATATAIYRGQIVATPQTALYLSTSQAGAAAQGGGATQIPADAATPCPVDTTDAIWVSGPSGVTVSVLAIYEEDE